jgi:hypothetical protein
MPQPCQEEMTAYKEALGNYLDAAAAAGAAKRSFRALAVGEAACVAGVGGTGGLGGLIIGGACVELFFDMEQAGDDWLAADEDKNHAFSALEDAEGTLQVCLGNHKSDPALSPGTDDDEDE